jgi:hypothetical protein
MNWRYRVANTVSCSTEHQVVLKAGCNWTSANRVVMLYVSCWGQLQLPWSWGGLLLIVAPVQTLQWTWVGLWQEGAGGISVYWPSVTQCDLKVAFYWSMNFMAVFSEHTLWIMVTLKSQCGNCVPVSLSSFIMLCVNINLDHVVGSATQLGFWIALFVDTFVVFKIKIQKLIQ